MPYSKYHRALRWLCRDMTKECQLSCLPGVVLPVKNEKGAVLVIAIMILAVLTVLGIAALDTTDTEIRISANDKVYKQAFYNAEAGLAYALQSGFTLFPEGQAGILTNFATPADLQGVAPNTTLQYIDNGGSPRRVEVYSTGNVPGGGVAMVIAGIASVVTGAQKGYGMGEQYN